MTVGELIKMLKDQPENEPVYIREPNSTPFSSMGWQYVECEVSSVVMKKGKLVIV